jgi:PDZ domain-containing protein
MAGPEDVIDPEPVAQPPDIVSARARKVPIWGKLALGVTIFVAIVAIAGFVIHVPYSTISPGEAVPLTNLVSVDGAHTYATGRGDIRLLFVRERNHINLWRYLQAHLNDDIDLFKEQQLNPTNKTQTQLNDESAQEMADAKTAATKVALQAAGYTIKPAEGVTISDIDTTRPAAKALKLGDIIVTADGKPVHTGVDLTTAIKRHKPGDDVTLGIVRDGKHTTVKAGVSSLDGRPIIGVIASPRYSFPVKVSVDTAGIGGPSAGLAMTLAILDDLTPGDLTGGKRVAVTGTIDPAGNVGEIGGINQKAVAARAAGAQIFIVPKCGAQDPADQLAACNKDLQRATERAGKNVKVIPVATFTEALDALSENGGVPVTAIAPADRAA